MSADQKGAQVRAGCRGPVLVLAVCLLSVFAPGTASAAAKEPGWLRPADLPARLQAVTQLQQDGGTSAYLVDPKSCTQTPAPIAGLTRTVLIRYQLNRSDVLSQQLSIFKSAKAAKTGFARLAESEAAGWKCAQVPSIPTGATSPNATATYTKLETKKLGGGTFASVRGVTTSQVTTTTLSFLSGVFVVNLGTTGSSSSITQQELLSVAPTALKRLTQTNPPLATSTTSTTAKNYGGVSIHEAVTGEIKGVKPVCSVSATSLSLTLSSSLPDGRAVELRIRQTTGERVTAEITIGGVNYVFPGTGPNNLNGGVGLDPGNGQLTSAALAVASFFSPSGTRVYLVGTVHC